MKIAFLVHNIYGIGGTVRTVINLAEALSVRHEVEIVSVYRRLETSLFDISPQVRVTPLIDMRPEPDGLDRDNPLYAERSRLVPPSEEFFLQYNALSDQRIVEYLRGTDADVVIGTRPSLALLVAEYAPDSAVRLAQEHMSHTAVPAGTRAAIARLYKRIDAAVTVTEADAESFRTTTPVSGLRVLCIPNGVPVPRITPADCSGRTVVAAGRLIDWKRYDLLIHAFARVLREAPDWKLRIYGSGTERGALTGLIQSLGIYNSVTLMGSVSPMEAEWVKGSIAAVASDFEPFGMTLVEAMRCGVPVVSTACPDGPPEILRHGEDGLLVPVGDIEGFAAGLLELIRDEDKRRRMGRAALENSRRFDPDVVARQYEALIAEICAERELPLSGARRTPATRRPTGSVVAAATAAAASHAASPAAPGGVRKLFGRAVRAAGSRVGLGTPPAVPATSPRAVPGQGAPVGGCVADRSGAVTVTVDWPGFEDDEAKLVCRERTNRKAKVRAALRADGRGRFQALLPVAADKLYEGRWDLFVETGGKLHRLRAGIRDLRELVSIEERISELPVRRHVPYATLDGFLAVRAWVRDRHAEVTAIQVCDEGLRVEGRLVAELFGEQQPVLTVRSRGDQDLEFRFQGSSSGGDDFRFLLPVEQLVESRLSKHEDWDLWVGRADVPGEARLARVLTDMADLKGLQVYPSLGWVDDTPPELAHDVPGGTVRIRPYVAQTNEISLNVVDRA
ncbi:glycosyltransferase family 4 protein [Peterkaempfera griseoplana]|uniref:glycosyltransferase family 4 protein n=1 Tax=Peterkaempfera griseoplana TaxID=66896 RepID=UPI0007C6F1BC|nr:glycosyltransferase family 4 protein [Peterkaempfera griseoplana]